MYSSYDKKKKNHYEYLSLNRKWHNLNLVKSAGKSPPSPSPENSNLLHQLFLTDDEALSVIGNSYSVIPQNLMYKKGTNKTRKEIIQELRIFRIGLI